MSAPEDPAVTAEIEAQKRDPQVEEMEGLTVPYEDVRAAFKLSMESRLRGIKSETNVKWIIKDILTVVDDYVSNRYGD